MEESFTINVSFSTRLTQMVYFVVILLVAFESTCYVFENTLVDEFLLNYFSYCCRSKEGYKNFVAK
jgi:hypothetical protein